ncbi:MAG: HDIG domain-containing metalloprotein [Candidatus Eisenbacteria bacterium]
MLRDDVKKIWPEIDWISDAGLREKVLDCWVRAFELSPLQPSDLDRIPFTLLVPDCPVSFLAHKRLVVHVSRSAGERMQEFFGASLPIDMDVLLAGAILADVGKLLEYEKDAEGKSRQSARGKYLRHPFTGVAVAMECGLPDAVTHIVATHAGEGNLVTRSVEAYIVHHADFMTFEPFVKRLAV